METSGQSPQSTAATQEKSVKQEKTRLQQAAEEHSTLVAAEQSVPRQAWSASPTKTVKWQAAAAEKTAEQEAERKAVQKRENEWVAKVAKRTETTSLYRAADKPADKPFSGLQQAISAQQMGFQSQLAGVESKGADHSCDVTVEPSTSEQKEQEVKLYTVELD